MMRLVDVDSGMGRRGLHWDIVARNIPYFAAFLAAICALPSNADDLDAETISAQNAGAVLLVVGDRGDTVVQGSGCCIDAQAGLVLTTAHQTVGVSAFRALLPSGEEYKLELLESDIPRDLALLRADRPLPQAVQLGATGTLGNGAEILSISSPKGIAFSTYKGAITNVNYERNGHPVILTDLPLNPGASGGPVFDRRGVLIGLVSGNVTEVNNTVVVPIELAQDMICAYADGLAICGGPDREEPTMSPPVGASDQVRAAVAAYNKGVEAGDPKRKVTQYKAAVDLLPSFYEAWFNLAVAHAAMDDLAAAADAYLKARQARPDSARVRRNLGQVYLKSGKTAEGARELEKAVELAPGDERAHNDLGEAYRRLNRLEQAASTFEKAIDLREAYPAARYNLGLTYAQLGRNADAVEQFRAYLELVPGAKDAGQVREWIDKLEESKG